MLIIVLLTGAMMVLGRATPLPEEVALLHLGDMCELPCWIGITPGKTKFEEAKAILSKVYNQGNPLIFDPMYHVTQVTVANGMRFSVNFGGILNSPDSIVSSIALRPVASAKIPVAHMLNHIDLPQGVRSSSISYGGELYLNITTLATSWINIYLAKDTHHILVRNGYETVSNQLISISQPVEFIWISSVEVKNPLSADYTTWHGFGMYSILFPNLIDCACD